jgi:5-methylcytosine-specific restriction enzyme subunit McrC
VSEPLTLFEHETKPVELTARQLVQLDQLQRQLPEQVLQPVYRADGWALRAGQYVGVVRLGAHTIQILPKIYRSPDTVAPTTRAGEATANLLHMLAYAGLVRVQESAIADLLSRESDWFEILTHLFASHLHEEWRRGPTRSYQTVEDELPLLKGKWRLSAQFRRPDKAHRFAVAYDQFTIDIALNRILRFVVERLSRLTRSSVNARLLGELRGLLDDVSLVPAMTTADADRITFNRLNARYEPVLNLARLFLDNGALQTASGDTSLFAFVFDMNVIFEGFIAGFLHRHRGAAIPPELQPCALAVQARGRQLHLARSEGHTLFRLKPDLLFRQGDTTRLIADTKYKRLDPADRKLGISTADFYQMFAYAQRYDCPRVVLVYPQSAEMAAPVRRRFQVEGSDDKQILAATIDIRRDLGKRHECDALAAELATILSWR